MFVIRLYISALTITLFIVLSMKGLGLLETVVIACPLLYLILDMRQELNELKLLEARVASLWLRVEGS